MANVGDTLTPWLVERIAGAHPTFAELDRDGKILVGAGSVLNWARSENVVWGAGLASFKDEVDPDCCITAVRGPLSRAVALAAGAACPAVYGDPGLLLPQFLEGAEPQCEIGIVPHYVDQERAAVYRSRARVINVLQPVEAFVAELTSCQFIFSSSLHGLVIADGYGIANAWVRFSDSIGGDNMKFYDHFEAVGRRVDGFIDCRENEIPLGQVEDLKAEWRPELLSQIDCDELMAACPLKPGGWK